MHFWLFFVAAKDMESSLYWATLIFLYDKESKVKEELEGNIPFGIKYFYFYP